MSSIRGRGLRHGAARGGEGPEASALRGGEGPFFEIGGANMRLPVKMYRPSCDTFLVVDMADAATDETQDAEEGVWLLGTPFFRHFTVVFDFDERKVGFAKTKKLHASFLRSQRSSDGLVTVPLQRIERGAR